MMKTMNQLKALVMCGVAVILIQLFSTLRNGTLGTFRPVDALIGMAIIVAICLVSIKIKEHVPLKIPAFAWTSLLALLLSAPFCPIQGFILHYTGAIATGQVSTLIMAVAGVTLGSRLNEFKKLSWKMIVVAIVVFCGTYFGSALVAHLILSIQGII